MISFHIFESSGFGNKIDLTRDPLAVAKPGINKSILMEFSFTATKTLNLTVQRQ